MVASLRLQHYMVLSLKVTQTILLLETICKKAGLSHNPLVLMIILIHAARSNTTMVTHILVEMLLTITIMVVGVIRILEIKSGILIELIMVELPTCSHNIFKGL